MLYLANNLVIKFFGGICVLWNVDTEIHSTKGGIPYRLMNVDEKNFVSEQCNPREATILPLNKFKIRINIESQDKYNKCFRHICKAYLHLEHQKMKLGAFNGSGNK